MLNNEIIPASHSPFSSPDLLAKKKDGTWRIYVYYRNLNKIIFKDKFPISIPLMDNLLDELNGGIRVL